MAQTHKTNIEVRMKGANKAAKGAGKVSKGMSSLAKSALAAGAAYFGSRAILNALKSSVELFKQQEMAEKKLQAALGYTSMALMLQARALQKVTMFGDEQIMEAQALIGSFVKEEDAIAAATRATLDLAAAKGMELTVAADLVSKTLGSSTNAMSRYGIEVVGAVGSTERLESLTSNIAKVFGGQAKAQTDTLSGAMQQLDNRMGDVGESFGEVFAPSILEAKEHLVAFAEGMSDLLGITPDVDDAIRQATSTLRTEEAQLRINITTLKMENVEKETRKRIIEELNSKWGVYTQGLLTESSSLQEIAKFQKKANEHLQESINLMTRRAIMEFNAAKTAELSNDTIQARIDLENRIIQLYEQATNSSKRYSGVIEEEKDLTKLSSEELIAYGEELSKNVSERGKAIGITERNAAVDIGALVDTKFYLEKRTEAFRDSIVALEEQVQKGVDATAIYNDMNIAIEAQNALLEIHGPAVESSAGFYGVFISSAEEAAAAVDVLNAAQKREILILNTKQEMSNKVLSSAGALIGLTKNSAKALATIQAAQALSDAYFASQVSFKQAQKNPTSVLFPAYPYIIAGATLAQGLATAAQVKSTAAAEGMNEIVTEPTLILAGEAGAEYVDIDPLTNEGAGRGGGVNITFSGNILSQDWVESEAIPMIKKAIRKGGDIGIS